MHRFLLGSLHRKLWTIGHINWSAPFLSTRLTVTGSWVSNKLFVWCKLQFRLVQSCGFLLTWNRFLFASVFRRLALLFHRWNQWIATHTWSIFQFVEVAEDLYLFTSSCRCYFFHHRLVLDGNGVPLTSSGQFKFSVSPLNCLSE